MKKLLYLILLFTPLCYAQVDTVTIYFNVDEFILSDQDENTLSKIKSEIEDGIVLIGSIQAHTDTTGSISHNEELSTKRLHSVLVALTSHPRGINTESFGESIAAKDVNYESSQYRKVDVILTYLPVKEEEIIEIVQEEISDEQKLNNELNSFLKDSTHEVLVQLHINFYPGKAILLEGEELELRELYLFLRNYPKITAKIRGHVCCGSNMLLSENRAYVVYNYLIDRGISPNRLTYRGYDNSQPYIWPEETEEDKKKNRRVDVVFTK